MRFRKTSKKRRDRAAEARLKTRIPAPDLQGPGARTEAELGAGDRTAATSSASGARARSTELEPELTAWIIDPAGIQVPPAPPRAAGRLSRTPLVVLAAVAAVVIIALVVSAIAGGPSGGQTLQGPLVSAVTGTTDRITPGEIGDGLTAARASDLVQPSEDEWKGLLPLLEESAAADPADDYAQRRLALAYYNLGRLDEAEAIYLRLLEAGEDPVLRNRLGNTLRDRGDLAGAETAYRTVIAAAPTLVAAYLNLAEILWRQDRDAEAILVINQGLLAVAAGDRAALEQARAVLESAAP